MATFQEKVKEFWKESKRVFLVTKKPRWDEYKKAAKITGLGIILIGLIGMLIRIVGILALGG
ncbi:protein translocase SEC61 complex subunit gamma [Pyrococcus kukulkanii]|uniref:Protein translocase subunit SecE n=1 Tax=Pyrococcus kukulkanii TaxID=1609559 RepID=A0A127BA87_9EURY|nr:protein translocase SEC61 complex subunit gamma [Pyrococcus kukulkanii]AMM54260.1 preprotein translocase subunit SecE [Pyrococcus kukulkanii]